MGSAAAGAVGPTPAGAVGSGADSAAAVQSPAAVVAGRTTGRWPAAVVQPRTAAGASGRDWWSWWHGVLRGA